MTQQEELAARVYEARGKAAQRAKRMCTAPPPYYMMNLGHPVVRALYDAWKTSRGIWPQDPPGDVERTEFELSLLSAETREAVEAYLDRIDAMAGPQRNGREPGRNGTSGPALPHGDMRGRGTSPRGYAGSGNGGEPDGKDNL